MRIDSSFNSRIIILIHLFFFLACSREEKVKTDTLFQSIPFSESGVKFSNNLSFNDQFNIYTYRNFYNGGGVALGDVNNDGLIDIYFTGNMEPNRLYLNKGNFKFEDITDKAGVSGTKAWSTGVSMADVNGDGFVDIYVCNSGDVKGDNKQNELFINNGDLTFTEQAEKYGLADQGFTTHAVFFDYDHDDDLDLYILNNSYQAIGSFNLKKNERPVRDAMGGDKLMRNEGDHFVNVSESAGIYGSVIGFGLGVTVGDINKDGWPDIYISNDFFERDYLYINNQNGTFKECLTEQMKSISGASMGADLADINNDAYPDIFVTEMLPDDNGRLKTVTTFENWNRYRYNIDNDYYHQFTRNMLQLNNGNGTFSEIGRLSKVEATDWSWGALLFDMDNDGLRDIFVANGIFQDLTNQDYLQYVSNEAVVKTILSGNKVDYKKLVELIPSTPVPDYAFQNQGGYTFVNKADEWGLGARNFSNGSAYGDLDNDGDLDLVVSEVNSVASVFKNQTEKFQKDNRYLKFELKGSGKNTSAFGTKITITAKGKTYYGEQMPIRGFQSSMDPRPNFGLGKVDTVDQIVIEWPDGKINKFENIATNQTLKLDQTNATNASPEKKEKDNPIQSQVFSERTSPVFVHKENSFVDFDRDNLIYHMVSTEGPRMSVGDVNNDGREDFFVGGAKDQPGVLFVQTHSGDFARSNEKLFEQDQGSEDLGSVFFDANNDGFQDLYVCSGGNEFSSSSFALVDRLYLNNGNGTFSKSKQILPVSTFESTSTVKAADFDQDGDIDLFVGMRLRTFNYGLPGTGFILKNDGKGTFTEVSKEVAPGLQDVGMITDAVWADLDADKDQDLVVIGEYMPIKVFLNEAGKLIDATEAAGLSKSSGWWNRIEASDIDDDGDVDFVVANHGLNSRFRASVDKPVCMYVNDFDQNGTIEQITCTYIGDKSYPLVLRHDLVTQIPSLKKKYLKYDAYKDETISNIFEKDVLDRALKLEAFELASSVLLNDGKGKFTLQHLPVESQFTTLFGIEIKDFTGDGKKDILLGGNFYNAKPEVGRYDASYGLLLRGDGRGGFDPITPKDSGIRIQGEVRDIVSVRSGNRDIILVSRNNDSLLSFTTHLKE